MWWHQAILGWVAALALPAAAQVQPQVVIQAAHTGGVNAVAVSADGQLGVSAGLDRTLRLWDLANGKLLRTLSGPEPFWSVALSPDGGWVLSGDERGEVALWDSSGGRRARLLARRHQEVVTAVAFAAGGETLISAGADRAIHFHDLATGALRGSIEGAHAGRINALAVSPDGGVLLSVSGASADPAHDNIRLWSLPSRAPLQSWRWPRIAVNAAAFAGDSSHAVLGGTAQDWNGSNTKDMAALALWDLSRGLISRSAAATPEASAVAVTGDGKWAVALGTGNELLGWSLGTDRLVRDRQRLAGSPRALALLPDGMLFAGSWPMLGTSAGELLRLIDLKSGAIAHSLGAEVAPVRAVAFAPGGGERLAVADAGGGVALWSVPMAKVVRRFAAHQGEANVAVYSPDGKALLTAGADGALRLWSTESGALERTLWAAAEVRAAAMSSDGKTIVSGSMTGDGRTLVFEGGTAVARQGGTLQLWDRASGQALPTIDVGEEWIESVALAPDSRTVAFGTFNGRIGLWMTGDAAARWLVSAEQAAAIKQLKVVGALAFSPNGALLVSAGAAGGLSLWSVASGRALRTLTREETGGRVHALAFTADGKRLLAGAADGLTRVFEVSTGRRVATWTGHGERVLALAASPGAGLVATGSQDGSVRLRRLDDPARSLALASSGEDWIIFDDRGDFDASAHGSRLAAMVEERRGFGIDQLALQRNRPDLLLQRMGLGSPEVIAHYQALHQRRLRRAGVAQAAPSPTAQIPVARILGVEQPETSSAQLRLQLSSDPLPLKSYQVFINDVPLHGLSGKPVSGKAAEPVEALELLPGRNKIEVSATNQLGAESLRAQRVLEGPPPQAADLYYLGFGVSEYQDPGLRLRFAHADARDLGQHFASLAPKYFARAYVHTFLNQQVTVENIRKAKELLRSARPRDMLVVFIAGHGMYDQTPAASYYYLTYESRRERLASTAAPFELLTELLDGIAPRRKLLLLDTCQSGERAPAEEARLFTAAGPEASARLIRGGLGSGQPPPAPRPFLLEHDRFIDNDLLRKTGAVVFSSSRDTEASYENESLGHGYFTAELLTALTSDAADANQDQRVSKDELRAYVSDAVAKRSHGAQNPTIDRDNLEAQIELPILGAAASDR